MPSSLPRSPDQAWIGSCPVCAGPVTSLDLPQRFSLRLPNPVTIQFACCEKCGFVFQRNPVTGAALEAYYRNSPKLRLPAVSESERDLFEEQASFMAHVGGLQGASVLDVGADMGKLLDVLRERYQCRTYYVEHNEVARQYLRSRPHLPVDSLETSSATRYDWIVLAMVLEHIVDPVSWLRALRPNSDAGAKLFIEVPCHAFWDHGDLGFSFEHVSYFSPAALSTALDRGGYVVERLVVTTHRRYFGGSCRIIRAAATAKAPSAISLPDTVRSHYEHAVAAKFDAIVSLGRRLAAGGPPRLALYAAGELADLLLGNRRQARAVTAALFDSDPRKHGAEFHGFAIRPERDIPLVAPAAIVVLSSAETDIRRAVRQTGYAGPVIGWSELSDASDAAPLASVGRSPNGPALR